MVSNIMFGHDSSSIAKDFANHLKYDEDANLFHSTPEGKYEALAKTIKDSFSL